MKLCLLNGNHTPGSEWERTCPLPTTGHTSHGLRTVEIDCARCGQTVWPYLPEIPTEYVCHRCRVVLAGGNAADPLPTAARRERGRRLAAARRGVTPAPDPAPASIPPGKQAPQALDLPHEASGHGRGRPMTARGHLPRGPGRPVASRGLTAAQREEIRSAHKAGASKRALAQKYGVTMPTIFRVLNPEAYARIMLRYWSKVLERGEASRAGRR